MPDSQSPTTTKYSLGNLREVIPDQYSTWVLWSVRVCLVAYAATSLTALLQFGWLGLLGRQEFYALLTAVGAYLLLRSGRVVASAYLAMTAVTLEILWSLAISPKGMHTPSLYVIPPLVVGAGLLIGARAGYTFGVVISVLAPATVEVGARVAGRPGISTDDSFEIVTLLCATAATVVFLQTFLNALATVLARAKENERRERSMALQLQHAQKLEAVGQLAGGVAHDFNNLLTVVAGYADFIGEFDDPRAPEVAAELRAANDRGVSLTRQLLAFARRERSHPEELDLTGVVEGAEQLIARVLGERIRLTIDSSGPCPLVADPGQLEQVVINLAANARDAMPDGGSFLLKCSADGQRVTLIAKDSGTGIPEEIRERVFEPFFTTKERGKGTGLGLSTVHGIVSQTHGSIDVDSRPNRGTTFTLQWPQEGEPKALPRAAAVPTERASGQGLIVLAEDDGQTRRLVETSLRSAGYEVHTGKNGAEALSIVLSLDHAPELVISDVMMPGMSGTELAKRVRSDHPRMPIIFISGYTADVLDPEHLDEHAELLAKPFTRDELLARVAERITRAQNSPSTPPGA